MLDPVLLGTVLNLICISGLGARELRPNFSAHQEGGRVFRRPEGRGLQEVDHRLPGGDAQVPGEHIFDLGALPSQDPADRQLKKPQPGHRLEFWIFLLFLIRLIKSSGKSRVSGNRCAKRKKSEPPFGAAAVDDVIVASRCCCS